MILISKMYHLRGLAVHPEGLAHIDGFHPISIAKTFIQTTVCPIFSFIVLRGFFEWETGKKPDKKIKGNGKLPNNSAITFKDIRTCLNLDRWQVQSSFWQNLGFSLLNVKQIHFNKYVNHNSFFFSSIFNFKKYNSYTMKFTLVECTIQWFSVYLQSHATITSIK